jgi:alpha-1,2-rhamnosyltransferase
VFSQPWVHAGIQRVVRNIAAQQINSKGYATPLLVALKGDQVFQVKSLIPCNRISTEPVFKLFSWVERAQAAVRRKLESPDYYLLSLPRRLLLRAFLSFAWMAIGVLGFIGVDPFRNRAVKFDVQEGDTLLLLDASWHDPAFFEQVASLKQRGIRIVAVAYDLIPIRHPDYCGAHGHQDFLMDCDDVGWVDGV